MTNGEQLKMNELTNDLSDFGYIELMEASKLLKEYAGSHEIGELSGVTLNFNKNSGYVFLSDEDYRVFMLDEDKIKEWFNCFECGFEGFDKEMTEHKTECAI